MNRRNERRSVHQRKTRRRVPNLRRKHHRRRKRNHRPNHQQRKYQRRAVEVVIAVHSQISENPNPKVWLLQRVTMMTMTMTMMMMNNPLRNANHLPINKSNTMCSQVLLQSPDQRTSFVLNKLYVIVNTLIEDLARTLLMHRLSHKLLAMAHGRDVLACILLSLLVCANAIGMRFDHASD
jgi:hypothetical protein